MASYHAVTSLLIKRSFFSDFKVRTSAALLRVQEKPAGASAAVEDVQEHANAYAGSIPDAAALGGWGAVDSAFADTLFKSGCRLFTQFYKGKIFLPLL